MKVHLPPSNPRLQTAFEVVTHLDREGRKVAWSNIDYPKWMIDIERWQVVSEVEVVVAPGDEGGDGDGDGVVVKRALYETRCVFCGPGAYVVKPLHAKALSESFKVLAEDLKKYCEGAR